MSRRGSFCTSRANGVVMSPDRAAKEVVYIHLWPITLTVESNGTLWSRATSRPGLLQFSCTDPPQGLLSFTVDLTRNEGAACLGSRPA